METILNKTEKPDSIELGSPGRRLKVYFNADHPAEAKRLIESAIQALKEAEGLYT